MPHQCTACGRQFDDGSKEMLSGCPNCGGNKFQFHPDGVDASETADEPPAPPEADMGVEGSVAKTVGSAATAVRDLVGSSPERPDPGDAPEATEPSVDDGTDPLAAGTAGEDTAQASARTDVVSPDELPPAPETPLSREESRTTEPQRTADPDEEARDRPDLADLRAELNDQFESIKVLEPGQYELNLMELYDREEYIVALQEDGKYTIQVPDRWQDD